MHPILHFKTITKHKLMVMRYCFKMGLIRQGLLHDLSKYSPTEFIPGAIYYLGDSSPNNAQRADIGVSTSWLHHKGRNKHHFEYWIDYSLETDRVIMGTRMPRKYVAEMIADRISACRTYIGEAYTCKDPWNYYLKGRKKLWFVHPETKRDLEYLLKYLYVNNEEKTIKFIKNYYLKGKKMPK